MTTTTKKQASPQDEIKRLAKIHGYITPEIVLSAAKPKSSPLHSRFCWDDTTAANEYRILQAKELIRRIQVTYDITPNRSVSIRAFHNVSEMNDDDEETRFYVDVESALGSYRDQLLAQCARDMAAFKEKYRALTEVSRVIDAMEKTNLKRKP